MVYHGHSRGRRGGHALDDSIGNRKGPGDVDRHLPDDFGNRKGPEDGHGDVPDDIGNRLNGPVPGSRSYLRGKLGKKQGKRPAGAYKDMESLYAAQGDGVPWVFRPGLRPLPTGELASVGPGGELKPTGLGINGERLSGGGERMSNSGERLGNGGERLGNPGGGERPPVLHHPVAADANEGGEPGEPGEGKRKRRRRRKRKGGAGGEAGAAPGGASASPVPGEGGQGGGWQGGFEDEEEAFRYVLKSDPEVKRAAALKATEEILKHAGRHALVSATVHQEPMGPRVVVEIQDKGNDGALFGRGSAALSALTFLVNKIINRFPDDRIRLSIVEAGTYVPPPPAEADKGGPAPSPALPWGALAASRAAEAKAEQASAEADEGEDEEEGEDGEEQDGAADEDGGEDEGEEEGEEEAAGEDDASQAVSPKSAPRKSGPPAARSAAPAAKRAPARKTTGAAPRRRTGSPVRDNT